MIYESNIARSAEICCFYSTLMFRSPYSSVRVQRMCFREDSRPEDRRAFPTGAVIRHDVKLVRSGLKGHTRRFKVVAIVPARKQHLADGYPVAVENEDPALPVHGDVDVAVTIHPH